MRIAYDTVLMRPACVLLQAAMGATVDARLFPYESWLTHPTPDMRVYKVDQEQLDLLVSFAERNGRWLRR